MAEKALCKIDGCGKPVVARGLCKTCYARMRARGDLGSHARVYSLAAGLSCSVTGCSLPVRGHGLCGKHLHRLQRYGDPQHRLRPENGAYRKWIEAHLGYTGDECLPWPFARSHGYGPIGDMCEAAYGPAPERDMEAAHSCGNGHLGCINPKHLRWATHAENQQEMAAHGRSLRGSKNPFVKLSEEVVREIRKVAGTSSNAAVAKMFGVSRSTVSDIKLRRSWHWLE